MLIALTVLYNCKDNVDVAQKHDDLKKMPYIPVSNKQKLAFASVVT